MIQAPRVKLVQMPNPPRDEGGQQELRVSGQLVIVGANGSGKSRLGAWLENPASLRGDRHRHNTERERLAYRIGAQRVLTLPANAQRMDSAAASTQLIQGSDTPGETSRVQGDPVVAKATTSPYW